MVHGSGDYIDTSAISDASTMPSVSVRFAAHSAINGIPFEAYDPFFNDFKGGEYSLTMEDFGDDDHPTCGYSLEGISAAHGDDFFLMIRSPTTAIRRVPTSSGVSPTEESEQQQQQ